MDENKTKALSAALSQIEKQFGKGSIMRLGESDIAKDIQVVSTGSLGLDVALEALRDGWRSRKLKMGELVRFAKICRVANVMRPYLESLS